MKRWLLLLVISLVFAGCNGGKQEEKPKTQATQKKKTTAAPRTAAIPQLESNKSDVVLFLNRAEHVLEELYYAAATSANGKPLTVDGTVYRPLPARYDTKEEILSLLTRYWSMPLAENLYDNLRTRLVRGNVYLAPPQQDYPVLISVRNTKVSMDDKGLLVTVTDVTTPGFAQDRTLRYQLVRDDKTRQFKIISRAGAYGSEMFH